MLSFSLSAKMGKTRILHRILEDSKRRGKLKFLVTSLRALFRLELHVLVNIDDSPADCESHQGISQYHKNSKPFKQTHKLESSIRLTFLILKIYSILNSGWILVSFGSVFHMVLYVLGFSPSKTRWNFKCLLFVGNAV